MNATELIEKCCRLAVCERMTYLDAMSAVNHEDMTDVMKEAIEEEKEFIKEVRKYYKKRFGERLWTYYD